MPPEPDALQRIIALLSAAAGKSDTDALIPLREGINELTALIDETMARAVVDEGTSIRAAGAGAGLTENAVGPRLAKTRTLGGYANSAGRVTAAGVERARYDKERDEDIPTPALQFTPRRRK
ncbi:hypothetical protein [Tsukamurella tyrosinosolvens]|uniref:Uncharacterized protein n=1 Tax=Tsukamurella tyrosinosolvens TaxID=57704 RepID=A0A1H4MDQ7_TSUTY|nr:hypothetical protein [Tsukamurella tyrosinosolvens]SEB80977.1 hypothetical protein SAMN04489793_0828 [Tsukamurella tyrosinosolvens]